ncbi:MAG: hypothetical protein J6S05_05590 [Bacteroidaceae bacterium]|nr:hypothetical protein [Bacteroidaceae bacterium]
MRLGDLDALEQVFLDESKRLREYMNSEELDQEEKKYINNFLPTVEWARKTVHRTSTIDAVAVVRCKDCDFRDELYSGDLILCRRKMSGIVKDTDFCSYGKRKVTADEG